VNQGGVYGIPGVLLPVDPWTNFHWSRRATRKPDEIPANGQPGLKSGTNRVHGSAYYYNRNEALAASPVFAAKRSDPAEKQIARPAVWLHGRRSIFKDRTFFFLSFERQSSILAFQLWSRSRRRHISKLRSRC